MMKKYLLLTILGLAISLHAHAATIFTQAANQDVFEGQTFVVNWKLDTEKVSVNSVDLKIKFSADTLKADSTTVGSSIVSLWIQNPMINNGQGTISLTGGIPNGSNGHDLPIFSTTFEALKSGVGTISLDSTSVVLANDGTGAPVPLKFVPVLFTIQPKNYIPNQISSPTNPDQNKWYQSRNVVINFNPKAGTDYSFSFSSNVEIIPENQVAPSQTEFKYDNLPDGVYYFKVNSKNGPSQWTEVGVYRVQIDGTAPEAFTPEIGSDANIFNGNKFVSFSTVDKTSGISHYMLKVGLFGSYKSATSPYELHRPLVGDYVYVKAIDNTGNIREEKVAFRGIISEKVFASALLILILIVIWLTYLNRKKKEVVRE